VTRIFPIPFSNGKAASAAEVAARADLVDAFGYLGLTPPCRTLVLVGGAGHMTGSTSAYGEAFFDKVVGPLATDAHVALIDGGTDAGVMRLAGRACAATKAPYVLLGVAAVGTVLLPGRPASQAAAPLEPNHTHFILVPGDTWGAESAWIAQTAQLLADSLPSATVLVNGGDIAWQDVAESVDQGRPVFVVAASGRTADVLVGMVRGELHDPRAEPLIATGLIHILDPEDGPTRMREIVRQALQLSSEV
jgi:hypothetical protein